MRISSNLAYVVAVVSLVLVSGCASTSNSPYRDPTEVRGSGTRFTSYDFQQCAITMVDSMLSNAELERKIREQFGSRTPVVALASVANKTDRIFELRSMEQAIETRLVNSGRFDLIDRKAEKLLIDEKTHDAESVLTSDAGATDFGDQARADYLLTGKLINDTDSDGRTRDVYYQLTMKLINKKTGKIDWSGEKEIRKVSTRPTVGW
ncbi:MAG: penicillin-binding protein activator LpoB [Victivallales bacterium]|nr:penicillin-binding protein activator LpoB [Victivallales bacterium]